MSKVNPASWFAQSDDRLSPIESRRPYENCLNCKHSKHLMENYMRCCLVEGGAVVKQTDTCFSFELQSSNNFLLKQKVNNNGK